MAAAWCQTATFCCGPPFSFSPHATPPKKATYMRGVRTRVLDGPDVWIVDWDIPVGPHRFGFYRELRRLRKRLGLVGRMSTMSVLITQDRQLALAVFELAARYTERVHLYEAREAHV